VSTEKKIRKLVKNVLPKGKDFQLRWQPVGFGGYRVLRVVTPAWRSLPRLQRILKMQSAITGGLSAKERANILRVSVLTDGEYRDLASGLLPRRSPRKRRIGRPAGNGK
jgi:hypothetical protein